MILLPHSRLIVSRSVNWNLKTVFTISRICKLQPKTCCSVLSSRYYGVDSDYAKYADHGRVEAFYEWITSTSWIQTVEKYLISVHDFTGLPWWSSIVLCTIILRSIIMTPLYVIQLKNSIKYQQFLVLFAQVRTKLSKEVDSAVKENKLDMKAAKKLYWANLYNHRKTLYKKYEIPGLGKRYLLPLTQIPIWFSMSISLRHMADSLPIYDEITSLAQSVLLQLSQEGCLWFSNLCLVDSFCVLPVLVGTINLLIIEIYRGDGKIKPQGFQKFVMYTARFLSVIFIPIACQMPTAVVLYWLSSSLYGATQALCFRSRKVKKLFHIPILPNESITPYRDLFNRLRIFQYYKK